MWRRIRAFPSSRDDIGRADGDVPVKVRSAAKYVRYTGKHPAVADVLAASPGPCSLQGCDPKYVLPAHHISENRFAWDSIACGP